MKRLSLLWLALGLVANAAFAGPVDVNKAKEFGQKFVQNTLDKTTAELSLAYTKTSDSGMDVLYVFNYDQGFVVVAADDHAHPILGYTEGDAFDVDRIPEGLQYYLGHYARQIQYAIDENLPVDPEIAEQWHLMETEGVMMKTRMDKAVAPLLATTWDQGYPYNYYAPTCSSPWTGNHCYAGCVATAMSQVMKYWNWPETGVGEHSYSTSTYGGTISVNFGEATYNWSIMPNALGSSVTPAAQAVALLMYHCGVAVDMDYDPSGSGAHTEDVPDAIKQYFRYGSCAHVEYRDYYSRPLWEDMLIESFDRGVPVVYAGSDSQGGHAFNCDGYNDQRYFHFNWGWSGSYNNYYQIDALNTGNGTFNSTQRVVLEMIPDYIYEATVPAIESLGVAVADALTHTVTLAMTVPTVSVSGATLESIESIVVERNGEVIQTFSNPQPGEEITFVDEVPEDGCYNYTVYGMNNNWEGERFSQIALVGPNCTWKVVTTTTNFQGWNGGKLQFVGANGVIFKEMTMENSSPVSEKFQMPEGEFQLQWVAPSTDVPTLTISLKNSANQQVYNFSGASNQLNGVLYSGSNDCQDCTPPTNLEGEYYYENGVFGTLLSWSCDYAPAKFKVYRSEDGVNYEEIAAVENTENQYLDEVESGDYYYKVTAYNAACESTPAVTLDGFDYIFVSVTGVEDNGVAQAQVYPNPVKEMLVVQATGLTGVAVYNTLGQLVYRCQVQSDRMEVNTAGLESGVYTVNVSTENGMVSKRIVVIH